MSVESLNTISHKSVRGESTVATDEAYSPLEAAVARVRLLAERRLLWLDELSRKNDAHQAWTSLSPAVRSALLDLDSPQEERRFLESDSAARQLTMQADQLSSAIANENNPLGQIFSVFELTECEFDLLQVCLAAQIDRSLAILFEALDGNSVGYPTESMAARICGHGRVVMSSPAGGLAQWKIIYEDVVDPGEPVPLRVDRYLLGYLNGYVELDSQVLAYTQNVEPMPPLPDWPISQTCEKTRNAWGRGLPCRIHVAGPPHSGRRTMAASIAESLGSTLLAIDTDRIPERETADALVRLQRIAILHGCALAWQGGRISDFLRGGNVKLSLEFTISEPMLEHDAASGWFETNVNVPSLDTLQRRDLWLQYLPATRTWPPVQLDQLSERHCLQIGEISRISMQGLSSLDEILDSCRELNRGRLGDLGRLIDCPFQRTDLQLPDKLNRLLDEFLFEARDRIRFWENEKARRLFPRGTGLIALMSGASGTGKTMTAQVIAAELGLDLFRIDLATTVNKYIGETAKNLRRVFARAANMNAVLFFDEADALFSKRTEVRDSHDRYANADTNYLLQLVEDYPGIALLASNKQQNMDDAFVRRVRYLMYFPKPDAKQRLSIWRQLVHELSDDSTAASLQTELEKLAQSVEVTGAQIKNAALAAVFIARQHDRTIAIGDIHRGLERELGNQGRSLDS